MLSALGPSWIPSGWTTRLRKLSELMSKELHRDVAVLMASRGVRAFAFSYLSVIFAIYLSQLGYSTVTVGLVISTSRPARSTANLGHKTATSSTKWVERMTIRSRANSESKR